MDPVPPTRIALPSRELVQLRAPELVFLQAAGDEAHPAAVALSSKAAVGPLFVAVAEHL